MPPVHAAQNRLRARHSFSAGHSGPLPAYALKPRAALQPLPSVPNLPTLSHHAPRAGLSTGLQSALPKSRKPIAKPARVERGFAPRPQRVPSRITRPSTRLGRYHCSTSLSSPLAKCAQRSPSPLSNRPRRFTARTASAAIGTAGLIGRARDSSQLPRCFPDVVYWAVARFESPSRYAGLSQVREPAQADSLQTGTVERRARHGA